MKHYSLQLSDGRIVTGTAIEAVEQMKLHKWGADTMSLIDFMRMVATDHDFKLRRPVDATDAECAELLLDELLAAGHVKPFDDKEKTA